MSIKLGMTSLVVLIALIGCGDSTTKKTIDDVHKMSVPELAKIDRANWNGVAELTAGFSITNNNELISFKVASPRIQEGIVSHINLFIDADNNPNTGYSNSSWGVNLGAEYMITGDSIRRYEGTGWNWAFVSRIPRNTNTNLDADELEVEFDRDLIEIAQSIRVSTYLLNDNWSAIEHYSSVNYTVVDDNGGNHGNDNSFTIGDNRTSIVFNARSPRIENGSVEHVNIFIDSDNNPNTGYSNNSWGRNLGAEYMISGNSLRRYSGNGWNWAFVSDINTNANHGADEIEISISKDNVQTSGAIRATTYLLNNNWSAIQQYPSSSYTLTGNNPEPENGNFSINDNLNTITITIQSSRIVNANNISNSLFIDIDNNPNTGYNHERWQANLGAEYLIEGNNLLSYTGPGFRWNQVARIERVVNNDTISITINKDLLSGLAQTMRATSYLIDLNDNWRVVQSFDTISHSIQADVFLIQGQSNAKARLGVSIPSNEHIRSFGNAGTNSENVRIDLNWYEAQANEFIANGNTIADAPGFIGKWGMQMGDMLVRDLNKELIILNGAVGGTRIDQHQRDNNNPENLNTIYGRLLYRTNHANITDRVRAMFWYQGENDGSSSAATSIDNYKDRFRRLYNSWKSDYRNLEKIYMFQVRSGCGNPLLIMEAQRQIEQEYNDIEMLSTTGTGTTTLADNCHYTIEGYNELANRMQRLVKDDLYHIPQQDAHPPIVASVRFVDDRSAIDLRLREAQDLHIVGNPASDFRIENSNVTVESVSIVDNRTIRLNLSATAPTNSRLSYTGHTGNENSWVENSNNLGIVSFLNRAIE